MLSYRNDTRLTHDGKEEFKVTMGFGLHAGWAIEGAVGSLQKVKGRGFGRNFEGLRSLLGFPLSFMQIRFRVGRESILGCAVG